MIHKLETIIIGGSQAGLATSYHLKQRAIEHLVLEAAPQSGYAWYSDRWDSFTLLTPNWAFLLPGAEYQGNEPDGFMARDEIVTRLVDYPQRFNLPVQYNARVTAVEPDEIGGGYFVTSQDTCWQSHNVVIATGLYQHAKIPPYSAEISPRILQLHSGQYRNPQTLPPGAVLIAGSAQSGCQIAEELYQHGRQVYLCTGTTGRVPRRYRGKDVYEWMLLVGLLDRTVDDLPSPHAKFSGNPHVSGRDGGRTLNMHQFARDGVHLLGRLLRIVDHQALLGADLKENLAKADQFEADLVKKIDQYIEQHGLDAPPEKLPELRDGYDTLEITTLDLHAAGITTIIWALGYNFDFSMVKLPVFDPIGFPIQNRGVTKYPGLTFMGLPWLYKYKSGHLLGMGEDAEYIASVISAKDHG